MTLWGAILRARSRESDRHAAYKPPESLWVDPRRIRFKSRLHLTAATCIVSAADASRRNRNTAELLAEMPLCELQVADPTNGTRVREDDVPSDETNDLFLTVCLLGEGRTSCQPNLFCGPGSKFRAVWADGYQDDNQNDNHNPGHRYDVHVVGHELRVDYEKNRSVPY